MKAKEIYEVLCKNEEQDECSLCILFGNLLFEDWKSLRKVRVPMITSTGLPVKPTQSTMEADFSCIKEINQKGNAVYNLYEKDGKVPPFIRDGFKKLMIKELNITPQLEKYL